MRKIRRGLDVPISGETNYSINSAQEDTRTRHYAVIGPDYVGMKPTMLVNEGDTVQCGQPIFQCKKNEGLIFTAPVAGKIAAITRGEKRALLSVKIEKFDGEPSYQKLTNYAGSDVASYNQDSMRALLIESGDWASIRQRPFDKVAGVKTNPAAIFINAMDTQPLAPDPSAAISDRANDFITGVNALSKLANCKVFLCYDNSKNLPNIPKNEQIQLETFCGPHPAGNVGTHIHYLYPVDSEHPVFHVGYQDVMNIGSLIQTGRPCFDRVIALSGPTMLRPRLVRTKRGACLDELLQNEAKPNSRIISGSVLNGRASGEGLNFLSHYANQITAIAGDVERELLGWAMPGFKKFSVKNIYAPKLPNFSLAYNADTNGSLRALVPIGSYEKVNALDILPTQLLRALLSNDTDSAQELGCLDLAEEDMSLFTFVSTSKIDFGPVLRRNLEAIERDG